MRSSGEGAHDGDQKQRDTSLPSVPKNANKIKQHQTKN